MTITIIGLGPGNIDQLTLEAWRTLENASEVYLRTNRHPMIAALPKQPDYYSFDDLYDSATDFESLYQSIAARIIELGQRPDGVIYAVPGHPMVGEHTTTLIIEAAQAKSLSVKIIDGLSFIEPALTALGIDAMGGLQILDALDIAQMYHPPINPDFPALVAQLYSQQIASDVKLTLMNQYHDEYQVTLLHGVGTSAAVTEHLPLYEIDRSQHIAHLTTLYIPAMEHPSSFEALQEVMAHLRAPDGCPWDQKQTHRSLRSHMLEELHEVLEAIDADDPESLQEELGDLLMLLLFQGQIAIDEGRFHFSDVLGTIIAKMIRRHPHVWGDVNVEDASGVARNWDAIKQEEKGDVASQSTLDGLPNALPALMYAYRLQEKAAKMGFDWDQIDPVIAKVFEEIEEIRGDPGDGIAAEFGDLLFAVVNWARWRDVDPESALREANARFRRRFIYIETKAHAANRNMSEMSLQEMDTLWDEAKREGL